MRGHHRILSSALTRALKWGRIGRNPAQDATGPQSDTEETPSLNEEQLRIFLGRAQHESPYYVLYLMAALTGMRSSELAGLRWQDVDLRAGVVRVRQAFLRVGNQEVWKSPKSRAGQRTIAITESLTGLLRGVAVDQQCAKQLLGPAYPDRDLVFCQATGKPLWMRNVLQRDFYPLLLRCGLPRVTMHSLRHSSTSVGARAGVDPAVVQRRAGHSKLDVTMGIYRHVLEAEEHAAARAIEARLLGDRQLDGHQDGQRTPAEE
jgi:integrase